MRVKLSAINCMCFCTSEGHPVRGTSVSKANMLCEDMSASSCFLMPGANLTGHAAAMTLQINSLHKRPEWVPATIARKPCRCPWPSCNVSKDKAS